MAVGGWALLTWGGRVGLLTGSEASDPVTWLRVGGSLLAAGLGVWGLLRARTGGVWVYAVVTAAVWVTSLISVWTTPNTVGFRAVHTLLAAVSGGLAVAAVRVMRAGGGEQVRPVASR